MAEAEREGWLGEIEGLKVSLAGTEDKLAQIDATLQRQDQAIHLGMPAFPDITVPSPARKDSNDRREHPPAQRRAAALRPRHPSPRSRHCPAHRLRQLAARRRLHQTAGQASHVTTEPDGR
jgi:hypothetical protein